MLEFTRGFFEVSVPQIAMEGAHIEDSNAAEVENPPSISPGKGREGLRVVQCVHDVHRRTFQIHDY